MSKQKNKILNNPIIETGLSARTIELLLELGYTTINSIFSGEPLTYEELHRRIMQNTQNHNEEKLCAVQHAYNELVEYAKYFGIRLEEEHQKQKTIIR